MPLGAERRFGEGDRDRVGDIGAALLEATTAGAGPAAPPPGAEEIGEQVFRVEAAEIAGTGSGAASAARIRPVKRAFVTVGVDLPTVEPAALLRIRQQVVGARNVLEALLDIGPPRIEVRVILLGELAVSLFDLFGPRLILVNPRT